LLTKYNPDFITRKILTATQNPEKLELYASVCRQTGLPVDPIKLLEKLTRDPWSTAYHLSRGN